MLVAQQYYRCDHCRHSRVPPRKRPPRRFEQEQCTIFVKAYLQEMLLMTAGVSADVALEDHKKRGTIARAPSPVACAHRPAEQAPNARGNTGAFDFCLDQHNPRGWQAMYPFAEAAGFTKGQVPCCTNCCTTVKTVIQQ